jgi:hypothetical protein
MEHVGMSDDLIERLRSSAEKAARIFDPSFWNPWCEAADCIEALKAENAALGESALRFQRYWNDERKHRRNADNEAYGLRFQLDRSEKLLDEAKALVQQWREQTAKDQAYIQNECAPCIDRLRDELDKAATFIGNMAHSKEGQAIYESARALLDGDT